MDTAAIQRWADDNGVSLPGNPYDQRAVVDDLVSRIYANVAHEAEDNYEQGLADGREENPGYVRPATPGRVVQSSYMADALGDPDRLIEAADNELYGVDYDTMIGTGLSGALVVPLLARRFGKHWAIVRKPHDGSHSERTIEGTVGQRWIFVDDFVSTGRTRARVTSVMHEDARRYGIESDFVGTYKYNNTPCFTPASGRRSSTV